jgi:uncharacterized membrane protein
MISGRKIFLIVALIVAVVAIIGFSDLYFGYMSTGLNPIGLFVDFYFFLILYAILFLATGSTEGRFIVKYIIHMYQAF